MNYGLPYMGSKNKIAEWVVSHFPHKDNFYDLFCGGGAITHCALLSRKFKNIYMNDINSAMVNGFVDCINGKYKNEDRWISHDDFDRLKGKGDLYVDLCFSFGNYWGKSYAYSPKIEPLKKAAHYAIFFDDYGLLNSLGIYCVLSKGKSNRDRYLEFKKFIKRNLNERFQLESLERLQRLQSLEINLEINSNLQNFCGSYSDVIIKSNSLIYCDIPYFNTTKYNGDGFNYEEFYTWCEKQEELVLISEYYMPQDRFICIDSKQKMNLLRPSDNRKVSVEKIFVPKHQINMIEKVTLF